MPLSFLRLVLLNAYNSCIKLWLSFIKFCFRLHLSYKSLLLMWFVDSILSLDALNWSFCSRFDILFPDKFQSSACVLFSLWFDWLVVKSCLLKLRGVFYWSIFVCRNNSWLIYGDWVELSGEYLLRLIRDVSLFELT